MMKNIKKMILYVVAILVSTYHCQMYSWGPQPAFTAAVKATDEAVTKHTPVIIEAAKNLGLEGAKEVGDGIAKSLQHIDPTLGDQAAGTIGDKLKEVAPTLGREAAEKIAPALENVSTVIGVGVAIYGTVQAASIAGDVYNHFNPDEEKMARINAARETNEYFDAKRGLRTCLINNAWTPRNEAGIPTVCENFSRTFRMIAGKSALDEMVTNFKDGYKE